MMKKGNVHYVYNMLLFNAYFLARLEYRNQLRVWWLPNYLLQAGETLMELDLSVQINYQNYQFKLSVVS